MGYTAILGLRADLHLVGQDYSWASSLFYFGYLTASGLVAILLVRLPIGRFMTIAMYVSPGLLFPKLPCCSAYSCFKSKVNPSQTHLVRFGRQFSCSRHYAPTPLDSGLPVFALDLLRQQSLLVWAWLSQCGINVPSRLYDKVHGLWAMSQEDFVVDSLDMALATSTVSHLGRSADPYNREDLYAWHH